MPEAESLLHARLRDPGRRRVARRRALFPQEPDAVHEAHLGPPLPQQHQGVDVGADEESLLRVSSSTPAAGWVDVSGSYTWRRRLKSADEAWLEGSEIGGGEAVSGRPRLRLMRLCFQEHAAGSNLQHQMAIMNCRFLAG